MEKRIETAQLWFEGIHELIERYETTTGGKINSDENNMGIRKKKSREMKL